MYLPKKIIKQNSIKYLVGGKIVPVPK